MVPTGARCVGVIRRTAKVCFVPLAAWLALVPIAAGANQPAEPGAVSDTIAGSRARTRFVIALDHATDFQVFSLRNPNRVIIDLPEVNVQLPSLPGDQPVGLVKSFRSGLAAAGKMRVVIDVTDPVVVETTRLEPPKEGRRPRLVLEIVPANTAAVRKQPLEKAKLAHIGLGAIQPPVPRPAERPEVRAARMYRPLIVLDPGHGGYDSGALRNGTVEKDVVLAFGKALHKKLEDTGRYRVLMTRDKDEFIPLEERREFAERHKAALFIAIHADYVNRSNVRGATIYSLREGVANELARSARGERSADLLSGRELAAVKGMGDDAGAVRSILADLVERETQVTKERTSSFVKSVIEYMGQSTELKDEPDRSAAFAVLRTAKVPAVLIELAYVSNKQDAELLKSDRWRSKVADSITTAIDNYFSHQLARLPM
jgi:N-acetylmuramoyl-L-alanine amidase